MAVLVESAGARAHADTKKGSEMEQVRAGDKVRVEFHKGGIVDTSAGLSAAEAFVPDHGHYFGIVDVDQGNATVTILERAKPKEPAPGQRVRITYLPGSWNYEEGMREVISIVQPEGYYGGLSAVEDGVGTVEILEDSSV